MHRLRLRRRDVGVMLILVVLLGAHGAWADGGYIPQPAYPALPSIPVQRAMVTWRNGQETLVVESSFQTPSPHVAWIVPLPAEPTKLGVGDPAMLRSLSMSLRPAITHDLVRLSMVSIGVLMWSLILISGLRRRSDGRLSVSATSGIAALLLLALFLLFAVSLSSLGGSAGSAAPQMLVGTSQRVGNYDVTVLRPRDATDVSAWLTAASLSPLPGQADAVVNDYIARRWCFLVARLGHDGDGPATPHPLVATFPAATPVYPMKLTGINGKPTRVELIAVADQQLVCGGGTSSNSFDCTVADRFGYKPSEEWPTQENTPVIEVGSFYHSEQTGLTIGNPDVSDLLWDRCVVTKLVADLSPQQMAQDVQLSPRALAPYRQRRFSQRASAEIALSIILLGLTVLAWWIGIRTVSTARQTKGNWTAAAVVLTSSVALAGVTYWLIPTVPVVSGTEVNATIGPIRNVRRLDTAIQAVQHGTLHADATVAQLVDLVTRSKGVQKDDDLNPLTGRPRTYERLPGEYTIRTAGGKTFYCSYDADGREYRVELPAPSSTTTRASSP